MVDTVH